MFVKRAVREIMERKGIGTNTLARMMGKIPQTVTDRLGSGKSRNLSVDKLDEMVKLLGYRIVLIPDGVDVEDGWYEIDGSETEETK